jgi:pimeloyl-ACP methyl ester carboxylesterase
MPVPCPPLSRSQDNILHRLDLPGYRVAYRDTGGTGTPVILLHSLASSGASWGPQFAALSAAGFRAIAPDRRGWGDSSPTREGESDIGTAAGDVDALADALGLERFHLVGVAGGGFVALDYAAWRPGRLKSLVVSASTGKISEHEIQTFVQRIENPAVRWPSVYLELGMSYLGSAPDGVAEWLRIHKHARRQQAAEQPLRTANTFRKIAGIAVPSLVLAGGADQLAPPALMEIWAAHLPDHSFQIIGPAGHSMNWEYPLDYNRLLLAFLQAQDGKDRC